MWYSARARCMKHSYEWKHIRLPRAVCGRCETNLKVRFNFVYNIVIRGGFRINWFRIRLRYKTILSERNNKVIGVCKVVAEYVRVSSSRFANYDVIESLVYMFYIFGYYVISACFVSVDYESLLYSFAMIFSRFYFSWTLAVCFYCFHTEPLCCSFAYW